MFKKRIKVSVILPVYNVEPYIEKCLKSLQSQTLKKLEFIFIDDKSTDGSILIPESASKKDSRIRILYNEENMGPGPSRNRGIEIARGEYLSFIDPDDYVAPNYYETLYKLAKKKNADVVKSHVTAVNKTGDKVDSWGDASAHFIRNFKQSKPLFLCNQWEQFSELYRRDFIKSDDKLRFADTRMGEDSIFLTRVNLKNPSIHLSEDTEYYHLIRDDSLEGNVSFESCLEGIRAFEKRIEAFEEYDFPDKTEEYLRNNMNYYIGRFNKADKEQKDEELRQGNRRLFKEKLDAAISKLPESMNVTEGLKSYEELCHGEESFGTK